MPTRFKVVIAEDDAIIALDIKEQLEARGHHVGSIVSRADQVVATVRADRPDVVLMDVRLDGPVDGVSLAEEIFVCEDTPVVFLSAYADEPTGLRAVQSGAYGYLTKPVVIPALISTLGLAVHKHQDLRHRRADADTLGALFYTLVDGIVVLDAQGHVLFMNRAAENATECLLSQARMAPPRWATDLAGARRRASDPGPISTVIQRKADGDVVISAKVLPLGRGRTAYVLTQIGRRSIAVPLA